MAKRRGHGEGSIYQRDDGRWVGCLTLEDRKRKYYYGKTRREVQEKLRVALHEQHQGTLATGPQQKLGTYLMEWLDTVEKPLVRPHTYEQYRSIIKCHLLPTIGHLPIQKLTMQRVQALYAQKLDEGLKPKTVALIHCVLRRALSNAVKWNLVSRNVASGVSVPQPGKHEPNVLLPEQAQKLLATVQGERWETLILLAITTGMRQGEMLALRWSDIDFEQGLLYVRRTVSRVAKWIVKSANIENDPKTKAGRRKIMLPGVTLEALTVHRERQEQIRIKAKKWSDKDLVFTNRYGGYVMVSHMRKDFHKLVAKAGLPPMDFHDLRHSAATILLVKGVHPKVVQELLGHSSILITMDLYSHVFPSIQKESMGAMDDVFKPP